MKNSDYLPQRRKGAKGERCHFEQREKSFLDPSHSLGMTGLWSVTLRPWRPWREQYPNPARSRLRKFARAGKNFTDRNVGERRPSLVRAAAVKSAQSIHRSAVSR